MVGLAGGRRMTAEDLAVIALSTLSILIVVMCLNMFLFGSLCLYLLLHRGAPPVQR